MVKKSDPQQQCSRSNKVLLAKIGALKFQRPIFRVQ
jgi:hypothetical protein